MRIARREREEVRLWASCMVRPPFSPREVVVGSPDSIMLRTGARLAQPHRSTPRARMASRVKEDDNKNKNKTNKTNKTNKLTNKTTNNQQPTTLLSHFGSRLIHKRRFGGFLGGLGRCPVSLFGARFCNLARAHDQMFGES